METRPSLRCDIQHAICTYISAAPVEAIWLSQVRMALGSGNPVRRRLSSEQACNISRRGSCQLSNVQEQPSPPDILLHLASPKLPEGSTDANSRPWASYNALDSRSEEQLTEVTSPRKGQPLCREPRHRHDELMNMLSMRNFLNQEGCTATTGTCAAHPATNPLPSGQQVGERTYTASAAGPIAMAQGPVRAAMQLAEPMVAGLRESPDQHASATYSERSRHARMKAEQVADRVDGMDSHMRVIDTSIKGPGAFSGLEAQLHKQASVQPLPFLRPDQADPRSAQRRSPAHSSMQFPWPERGQGLQAMGAAPSMQQPELPLAGGPVQGEQRISETHDAQAEGAVHSFRGRLGQMLPQVQATDTSGPPVKQGAPQSAQAATRPGLAHVAFVPLAEQRSEASRCLAPRIEVGPLPAAQRPLHIVPHGAVGMPLLMARPRSACSPIAAAMQCPTDSTPPRAWGNTF